MEHQIIQTGYFTAGLEYEEGEYRSYKEDGIDVEYSEPSVFVEANLKGFAGPAIFLKFYGVAGPSGHLCDRNS